ncbi:hypothetical protein ABE65_016285 [Fictibacillus phosphorivorans]|uniref:Uncharacterized protein n=1 Tax=Fictibacillus phosphorivorans TaxID=1221500 RepID=A0A160IPD4_9BACL|nr:hypothetical protein [Fictibacillus phosphorivorans]ANC78273.1 hypothetical protein ABE65_016285 [Fictibacillus phosphorivorans]
MKFKKRTVIFTATALLTIGVLNNNDFESKVRATEQKAPLKQEAFTSERSNEVLILKQNDVKDNEKLVAASKVNVPVQPKNEETIQKPVEKERVEQPQISKEPKENKTQTTKPEPKPAVQPQTKNVEATPKQEEQEQVHLPETKIIDGYTYVSLMDDTHENLKHLVAIAKKHDASLYAIEDSDCFVMYDNSSDQMIMSFSTGINMTSIVNVDVLYDMHPTIKDQIQEVIKTGEAIQVKEGENQGYFISKVDGKIRVSF